MRISDWSSDVCSSDLPDDDRPPEEYRADRPDRRQRLLPRERGQEPAAEHRAGLQPDRVLHRLRMDPPPAGDREGGLLHGARPRRLQGDEEAAGVLRLRSEEHTSELQSLMRNPYAVFCLKKKNKQN